MAIVEGAFDRVLFPTREKPRSPGLPHIAYCIGATATLAIVAYTTSKPWPAGIPCPLGVRPFDAEAARALGQRPFVLDLRRLAKLPISSAWFLDLETPTAGVIAVAPRALRDELQETLAALLRRHRALVTTAGPR